MDQVMPKWIAFPAMFLVVLIAGAAGVGYLTFSASNQFRERWLYKDSFAEAKREGQPAVDNFFFGKEEKALKRKFAKLDPANKELKAEYDAAVRNGDDAILGFLDDRVLPSFYQGLGMLLGMIALAVALGFLCRPLFLKYNGKLVFSIALTGLLGGWFAHLAYAGSFPMGIDLAGGTELIYRLEFKTVDRRIADAEKLLKEKQAEKEAGTKVPDSDIRRLQLDLDALMDSRRTAPEKAADVVRKRVDPTGTKGIPITSYDEGKKIRIQLPKASPEEVDRIKRAIMTQGRLTFHLCADEKKDREIIMEVKNEKNALHEYKGYELIQIERKDPYVPGKVKTSPQVIEKMPMLEGSRVIFAGFRRSEEGGWEVNLRFDAAGSARFEQVTGENVGRNMAIVLDGHCNSAPVIKERIAGECRISGGFTKKESQELASILTAGSLPAEVKEESEFTVGPALGQAQIESGFNATLLAAALVSIFIWGYYRIGGFVSVICMAINLTILMGALGFFKATMTLPGIAGIALTYGMAVDANVLIFERIREEQARGRPARLAVQMGFDRAFSAIIDSNLTTLLSGIIMYYVGTGPVRGFAVTLSVGILVTLLANLWIFQNIMEWLVSRDAVPEFKMSKLLPETKIDFMAMRKPWYFISFGLALGSLALFAHLGIFSDRIYDLDFTGGTLVQINFAKGQGAPEEGIKDTMTKAFEPQLQDRLTKVAERLEQLASSPELKDPSALRAIIYKELPEVAKAHMAVTTKLNAEDLQEMAASFRDTLKEFDRLRFTYQSFGEPDEKGNYRSFTVTTRNSDPLINEVIVSQVLVAFGDKVEPYAVSVEGDVIRVQFTSKPGDPTDGVKSIDLKAEVLSAINLALSDKKYEALKADLTKLQVGDPQSLGQPGRYFLGISGLPVDVVNRDLIRTMIDETHIKHQAEGPVGRKSSFGKTVSGEMRFTAIIALIASLLGQFVYLWFRFEFSGAWGFGAIVALFHDASVALGAVCLVSWLGIMPVLLDLNMIAALLTVIGYSVNDTIVIFDRIREVKTAHPTRNLHEVINESVNQTLARTILTSLTTLLAVLSLFLLGGPSIRDITFPLLVGMVAGIYSTVFIASPLMAWWYQRFGATFSTQPQQAQNAPSGAQI
jgi:SecD/SecF fusion protein